MNEIAPLTAGARAYEPLGLGGLHAVRLELDRSLSRARAQIEEYTEDPDSSEPLQLAARELHQVRGTASIIQCFGVAALAEEMKQCALDLAQGGLPNSDAALSALSAGLMQLGDYIDALLSGFEDCVLVLQPALNELRLARARTVLTEQDLFVAQMHALGLQLPRGDAPSGDSRQQAQKLLPHYQAAMVQWLRGESPRQSVSTIGRVAEMIATAAAAPRVNELWRIAAAGAEILLTRELADTVEVKRLFGRLGMNLKALADDGEWETQSGSGDVGYRLLYHIGRSRSRASRAQVLIQAFRLDVYLPPADRIDRLRRHLRGPGTDLLSRVASEIRSDLVAIQDTVDLAVRSGSASGNDLSPIASRLRSVGAALQMLGLAALHQLVERRLKVLPTLLAAPSVKLADWMDFATDLLQVEQSLEDALFRQLGKGYRGSGDEGETRPRVADWRHGVSAVTRESLINIAKLKEAVAQVLAGSEGGSIADCPRLIGEVAAAFSFIGPEHAARLFARLAQQLSRSPLLALRSDPGAASLFADTIAAAELYLETRRDGLPATDQRLADLELRLQLLEAALTPAAISAHALALATVEKPIPAPVAVPDAAAQDTDDGIDPAIREVFLEEAEEVLQTLLSRVPRWLREPDDEEALAEIRRSFHTLKGSGRMVGATRIAEFAWEVENLLNRCLDGTVGADAEVQTTVRDALRMLPQLVEAFRNDGAVPEEAHALAERARRKATEHRRVEDLDLRLVFRQDALDRIGAISSWLNNVTPGSALVVPSDALRAFHTLRGAGPLVGATHIGELAGRMEDYLEELQGGDLLLPAPAVPLVAEIAATLHEWVQCLGSEADEDVPADPALLIARIDALRNSVPESAVRSAADRHLAEIFAAEAFDLVEDIERNLNSWQGEPDAAYALRDIAAALHTLRGAALMSSCPTIAAVSQVFRERLDKGVRVDRQFFVDALAICEGLYQLLDDYRNGARGGDGEPWASRAAALPLASVAVADVTAAVPEAGPHPQDLPSPQPAMARVAASQDEFIDDELREIFLAEAEELLEQVTELQLQLRHDPADSAALTDLRRAMHTFKGSARMAGFNEPGDTAWVFEHECDMLLREQRLPDAAFLARLSAAAVNLCGMLGLAIPSAIPSVEDEAAEADEQAQGAAPVAEHRPIWVHNAASGIEARQPNAPDVPNPLAPAHEPGFIVTEPLAPDAGLIDTPGEAQPLDGDAEPAIDLGSLAFEAVEIEAVDIRAEPFGEHFADEPPAIVPAEPEIQPDFELEAPWQRQPETAFVLDEPSVPEPEFQPESADGWQPDDGPVEPQAPAPDFEGQPEPAWQLPPELASEQPPEPDFTPQFEPEFQAVPVQAPDDAEPSYLDEPQPETADTAFVTQGYAEPQHPEPFTPEHYPPEHYPPEYEPEFAPEQAQDDRAGPAQGHADEGQAEGQTRVLLEELDRELIEIFAAEASELMDGLDRDLPSWAASPTDRHVASEVLRALHTIKGGARMAGLSRIGSLVHHLETLLDDAQRFTGAPDAAAFTQFGAGVERLHVLFDDVQRGDLAAVIGEEAPLAALEVEFSSAAGPEPAGFDPPEAWQPHAEPPDPQPARTASTTWNPELFWAPELDSLALAARRETARVPVERLDAMLNEAGEMSICRSRLEQHNINLQQMLHDTAHTIGRVREQLRMLDIETEAQIAARGRSRDTAQDRYESEFDALEMDRYSRMQELSRTLAESLGDLSALHLSMDQAASESEALLQQQGRINADVQNGLMGTLMVPFARQTQRLQRVVRQTALDNGRIAELFVSGEDAELDRNVLERMTAPLEHLLRNAVVHGLETPDQRRAAGKSPEGRIDIALRREGTQLLIDLRDDGRGFDVDAIRETAIRRGLMPADSRLADSEVIQFIFAPGFSTARQLTQDAGRGIGMDVVVSEIKQLGGLLEIGSEPGAGARFLIRLPLTLAIAQSLLVAIGGEQYAIPLPSVEGIVRLPRDSLVGYLQTDGPALEYGGHQYPVRSLGDYIDVDATPPADSRSLPAILIRLGEGLATGAGERRIAVVVDQLLGNRQVVSKAVGALASSVSGLSGATILADGRVVLILDASAMVQDRARRELALANSRAARAPVAAQAPAATGPTGELVMVVDDSITMRRVAERLLQRHGFRVVSARDGLDAMAMLQTEQPSAILLDIEMPRADGFEVAAFVRNTDRIAAVPIIMITSRSGDKHRERARQLGVNRYLIKPYQEDELMSELRSVLTEAAA